MQHLDEGTIHAWLDGELAAEEAERVERHTAECGPCGALVADARGVVAGAARIVSALDAGPIGVVPRARPSTRSRRWPRFLLGPTGAALAATLLIAAVATLTVRRSRFDTEPVPAGRMIDSPAPSVVTVTPAQSHESSKPSTPATTVKSKLQSPVAAAASAPAAKKTIGGAQIAPTPGSAGANGGSGAPASMLVDKRTAPAENRATAATAAAAKEEKQLATPSSQIAGATRRDSVGPRVELKAAFDPLTRARPAADVAGAPAAAPARSALREVAVPAPQAQDAVVSNGFTFPGCYHLEIDSTNWRGVVPANVALDAEFALGGTRNTAQPANAVQALAAKTERVGYPVHAIATNGRIDSSIVGDWRSVGPQAISVRFTGKDQPTPVTLVLSTASAGAQIIAKDRTDSIHVVRMVCPR